MQLKKLEIKGFKSFGDRIVVNFDAGITGVVGPNGCGKSNIVDSIRWVLGEQKTRNLRSEKMENIIFNGTKSRKALQMAEVSLTFDNTKNLLPTEYSTVTITRRYYRSGESEYLLNGVTCRLKDINNLFLDTGIGPDSYAIIELKMVDDILNDKDNSRRNLFEEAAGISKFKIRKKQTLKKLEDTDKDLERVEDLVFEIEKNMKSLERQAKQAEKYLSIKEEYKEVSINLAKVRLESQRVSFNNLKEQLEQQNDLKSSLAKQIAEKEAEVEKIKAAHVQKEKTLSTRQKALNEHVANLRQYENEKKIKNERLRFLTDKSKNLEESINQDKVAVERIASEIKLLEEEKVASSSILHEMEATVNDLKQAYEEQKIKVHSLQEQVNTQISALRNKREEAFQLKKSLEISEVQLENLKKELFNTTSSSSDNAQSLESIEKQLRELAAELDGKQKDLDDYIAKEKALKEEIEATEKEIDSIKDELNAINRTIDSKENEYNLTKSLVDNLEGFPDAIKFLKKNSMWGKEAPLLSDILTCDQKYRVAIENYLETVINYYVVDEAAHAYQAINLLNDASKGKANFFILEAFNTYDIKPNKAIEHCIPVLDIVEFDSKFNGLIHYLLDGVYIQEGNAEQLPDEPDAVFITQSGKLTKRKYSVSGGSVGLFEGKRIGRAKNLEKLQKEIKTLSSKRDNIKTSLDKKQNRIITLKENLPTQLIEETKRSYNELNQQYIALKTKEEHLNTALNNETLKKEDLQKNIQIIEEGIQKNKPKVDLFTVELEKDEAGIANLQEQFDIENELLTEKSQAYNNENIKYHQQQNKIESFAQQIEYKTTSQEESQNRVSRNKESLLETDKEIQKLAESSETSDDQLVEMYKEKESIEAAVNEAEKDYYEVRGQIDGLEQEAREIQRKRENTDALLLEIQNNLNETKLSLTSIKERLSVEFNINLDQLLIREDEEDLSNILPSEEELADAVEKCKDKLERMGPINPMAMEAYNEIKERYDFIQVQRNDLFEAKNSLLTTISEIDAVAKENFLQSFDEIRENFIKVFRSLFTDEDKCDLKLTDPDNPLESAIEIMARPKGKRPLTINQLSGGEKTLTAVALLFSIYLLKPAPFCIFDEVDAPLDDANIDKFNNIIKKFSDESQFIIVTHNKRTMASTDVIYGVTMQEAGVSKLVPVDLRALEEA